MLAHLPSNNYYLGIAMDGIEEVKSRLNIEDVISEYVQLKRAGRNFKGISPFTSEKTASFIVSPEKQIWHDFSSGKGGNVFSFVMEMEGLEFKGALELLARKAGVDLEQFRPQGGTQWRGPDKKRLHELLELSTKFYQTQFSKNKVALEYVLGERKFSKKTALDWRLGYSPKNGTALMEFLARRGFTELEMQQAGVTAKRYRGVSDMFLGRLMIPLQDAQGQVIGFTARLLDDQPNAPKYINTPQTVLYDKSRHVYGLHLAKETIRRSQFAVLVEGNLDVIASHQADVRQAVATAGTAMTEHHLKILSRFTGDIRLCFDADRAGLEATERAIPIAGKVGVSLSIINIPSGKDPDELIKKDPKIWQEAVTQNQYALDWLMDRYKSLLNTKSAQGKRQYSDVLLPIVGRLTDSVEQDHYIRAIAEEIDVSRSALEAKLSKTPIEAVKIQRKRPAARPQFSDRQAIEHVKSQEHFLSLILLQPTLRAYSDIITEDMFSKSEAKQILKFLLENPKFDGTKPEEVKSLKPLVDYVRILSLEYEELYQGLELTELQYEAARLQTRLVEAYVKHQKQMLAAKLSDANESESHELLEHDKKLNILLKRVKGGV